MARETLIDSRQEILRTAARLFQQRGYDATSMNDVAAALKLSKGGLYHHFQSKDEILFEIMNHAMEITQERVIKRRFAASAIRKNGCACFDPPAHRSRAQPARPRDHRHAARKPSSAASLRKHINQRKKDYIHFVEDLIAEVQRRDKARKGAVSPRAAAFALLGMINWIYQWYKPEGELQANNLIPQFTESDFWGNSRMKAWVANVGEIDQQRTQSGKCIGSFFGAHHERGTRCASRRERRIRSVRTMKMRCTTSCADARAFGRSGRCEVCAGSLLFVAGEVEHRFYDVAEELAVLVFFAPRRVRFCPRI